jgi:hypothetical protein
MTAPPLHTSASRAQTGRRPRRLTLFARVLITNTVLLVLAPVVAGLVHASGRHHFDPRFALAAGVPLLFLWILNFYFLRGPCWAYPGGIVDRVAQLSDHEYEVHNLGVNWPRHIFVNNDFKVVGADSKVQPSHPVPST